MIFSLLYLLLRIFVFDELGRGNSMGLINCKSTVLKTTENASSKSLSCTTTTHLLTPTPAHAHAQILSPPLLNKCNNS